jgi:hypothetical protein
MKCLKCSNERECCAIVPSRLLDDVGNLLETWASIIDNDEDDADILSCIRDVQEEITGILSRTQPKRD